MPVNDIKPVTPLGALSRSYSPEELNKTFDLALVAALVGMQETFVLRVLNRPRTPTVTLSEVLALLEQDAFSETFVPRSKIPNYLLKRSSRPKPRTLNLSQNHHLILGDARELIQSIPERTVRCVVTSTPYWGMRLYDKHYEVAWADGEVCAFGHEQTPEGFIRHTIELLYLLKPVLRLDGSVWWNLMDTYNTRTQIRSNAAETLSAMKGLDARGWRDYTARRYSAGHSYLKDGEQCLIPLKVAERASRIGYWVKSTVVWKKDGSMPETVSTRVTREAEHILHLSLSRSPYFDKDAFRKLPKALGGRNPEHEADKITDIWFMPTSNGSGGHGAQFPLSLPARCIALSTAKGDLVLDPFVGSGTTSVAAAMLERRSLGFEVSEEYLEIARKRLKHYATPLLI